MSQSTSIRLDWLDELRGVACIAVLLHHASYVFNERIAATHPEFHRLWFHQIMACVDFGVWGVFLFFLISGIVIPSSVLKTDTRPRVFIWHRILRIYPLYFASILLAASIWSHDVIDSFANATMFPRLFGKTELLGVYWSLQVEVVFYSFIAFSIYFGWIRTNRLSYIFLLSTAMLATTLAYYRYRMPSLPVSPALGLLCIAGGYCYFHRSQLNEEKGKNYPDAIIISYTVIIICLAYYARGSRYSDSITYTFSIALAFVLIYLYPWARLHINVLVRRGLKWTGTISYSIYLTHQLVLELGNRVFWWSLPIEMALLSALVLIYIAAYLSYSIFELPLIRIYRNTQHRKEAVLFPNN